MTKKKNKNYILFLCVFYLVIFRALLDEYIPQLGLLDEVYALMAIPLGFLQLRSNNFRIKKHNNGIFIVLLAFALFGIVGNVVYRYQPWVSAVLPDVFLNMKLWLSVYTSFFLFKNFNLNYYEKEIGKHIKFIVILFVIIAILDRLLYIFPGNIRYGMKSMQLFYGYYTVFAAICGFLIALLTLVSSSTKKHKIYLVILLLLMISTMRTKAFGAAALYIILYYMIVKFKTKIKFKHIVILTLSGLMIGWSQISYYFFSDVSEGGARSVLLINCIRIAKDHFPFGSGFATYASHYSVAVYSPIYFKYGISRVYGLTQSMPKYASDSFWPMIIGQNGYIGAALYIIAIVLLFIRIKNSIYIKKEYYLAGVFSLTYLCVSSLAEAAFVSSISVPFAIVIGLVLAKSKLKATKNQVNMAKVVSNAR